MAIRSCSHRMRTICQPALKKYATDLKERTVRFVLEARGGPGGDRGTCTRIDQQLGILSDTLHGWVARAEIDSGVRPGTTTDDAARLAELKREVMELRRPGATQNAATFHLSSAN